MLEGEGKTQLLGYAGYSHRMRSGTSWEVGISATAFSGGGRYNYGELYAGFAAGRVSGRLYYSPDYFGAGSKTLYAELNGGLPLRENLDLIGHLGLAHTLARGQWQYYTSERRADLRLGIRAGLGDWNAQLAWVAAEKGGPQYGRYAEPDTRALVLSVAYTF